MKKSPLFPTFLLVLLCLPVITFAQLKYNKFIPDGERFSAGVILGFNSSQIDGDYQIGFDKFGLTAGIRGIARITSRLDFNIEMLYAKKGSKIFSADALLQVNPKKNRIIDLTYIDAPIYFKWLLKDQANIWHIELGGIYARLIKTEISEVIKDANREFSYQDISQEFDKEDISALFGFGYTWANGIAFNLRYAIGVSKFYRNEDFVIPNPLSVNAQDVEFLRNYYYSLSISYTIFKRKLKNKSKKQSRR